MKTPESSTTSGKNRRTRGTCLILSRIGYCIQTLDYRLQKPLAFSGLTPHGFVSGFILHIWAISYRSLSWSRTKWWFLHTRNLPTNRQESPDTLNWRFQKVRLPTLTSQNQRASGLRYQKTDWWRPILTESSPYKTQFWWICYVCLAPSSIVWVRQSSMMTSFRLVTSYEWFALHHCRFGIFLGLSLGSLQAPHPFTRGGYIWHRFIIPGCISHLSHPFALRNWYGNLKGCKAENLCFSQCIS